MSKQNENRPGYKKTKVGWIPEEWEVLKFGRACASIMDGTHFSPHTKTGIFRYITSKNIRSGYLDLTACQFISEEEHSVIYSRCPVKKGQVLLTKDGANTGNACLNPLNEPFSLLSSVAFLEGKDELLNNEYLLHWILSPYGQFLIKNDMAGQAITRLTLQTIGTLPLSVPPLPEQKKIAEILSIWDKAIDQIRKLINAKNRHKKALMQQLLTGKRRLPGFGKPEQKTGELPEGWKEVKIENIVKQLRNGLVYDTRNTEGLPITRIETISNGKIDLTKTGRVPKKVANSNFQLQKGDILYSHINSMSHIGKVAFHDKDILLYHGMNLLLIRATPEKCLPKYLYSLFGSSMGKRQAIKFAKKAVNQVSINASEIKKMEFAIPSIEEQQAITQILSTADDEIKILEQKLSAIEKQKRGLMQKLLTGDIRVNR